MMKRLPSRNQRSKGIRVKHVLQILLLLGVCFWLIYQVKHNHDKKKEFAENDAKLSVRTQADQILKLGRKDLHPGKDEANQNKKHEEEEEDENILEDEGNKHEHNEEEDEGNKHETEESETEESEDDKHEAREQMEEENKVGGEEGEEDEKKNEELEDERRGGGDDEIDENDQEKTEVDTDRDEEFMDKEEEKEKEEADEKENENSEDEEKEGGLVENSNTHEAREEHYKGDDASSAVTHDTQTIATETEGFNLENTDVNLQLNITEQENKTSNSEGSDNNQNGSDLKVTQGELKDETPSNETSVKEAGNNSVSNPEDSSYLNKTTAANSNSHMEESGNMTNLITEASNNLTGGGANTSNSSEQNKIVTLPEQDHAQNAVVNTTIPGDVQTEGLVQSENRVSEENQHDSNSSTAAVKTENGDAAAGESSGMGAGDLQNTTRLVASNETENSRNESTDTSEPDKAKGDSETRETEETRNFDAIEDEMFKGDISETHEMSDSSSADGTLDLVEHETMDSSDTNIHEDVTKVRTDLDTLPDFRNEGENGDESAAE